MEQESLLEQGLELMLFGMGSVVIFLSLLVLATSLMSRVLLRFTPALVQPGAEPLSVQPDAHLLPVIAAAIHQHRARRNS